MGDLARHHRIIFNLRTPALLSLGFHVMLALTVSLLISPSQTREPDITMVRVFLVAKSTEKKPMTETALQTPMRNRVQKEEPKKPRLKGDDPGPPLRPSPHPPSSETPIEPPKPLPVAKDEEKQLESLTEVTSLISAEVLNLLPKEERPISFRDLPPNVENPQPPSVSLSPSPVGVTGTSFAGKDGGPGPGEGGGGGHGAARGKGNGDRSGSGLKTYGGGRGGHPGRTGGEDSGDGSGTEGGNSRARGELWEKLFSSAGGNGTGQPRYAENPKPPYPLEARERGYQGEVLLKVHVLTDGKVGQIEVKRSSGYELLDQSALHTVKQWKFIPARKGEDTIPMWVNIPVKFQLQ